MTCNLSMLLALVQAMPAPAGPTTPLPLLGQAKMKDSHEWAVRAAIPDLDAR